MPKGGWIITYNKKRVYPFDFKPEMIDLEDIAHALSNICRFTGHCRKFYSVAEHSVHVARILLEAEPIVPLQICLQGLLHDAEEAYVNDLSQPLKQMEEMERYCAAGKAIERTIFTAFGLPNKMDPLVKKVDLQMLHLEGKHFFGHITDWHPAIIEAGLPSPVPTLRCWSPSVAKVEFIETFSELWEVLRIQGGHTIPQPITIGYGTVIT